MKISLWTTALIFGWGMTAAAQTPLYPAAAPQVIETPDSVKILFPQQVGIVLQRRPGKFFSGIARLWVGSHPILSMPAGYDLPPFLVMMDDDSVGGITNWPAYLLQRRANNNTWPQVGGRAMWSRFLDSAQYVGYQIDGDTVRIQTTVTIDSSVGTLRMDLYACNIDIRIAKLSGSGMEGAPHRFTPGRLAQHLRADSHSKR